MKPETMREVFYPSTSALHRWIVAGAVHYPNPVSSNPASHVRPKCKELRVGHEAGMWV